MTTRRIILATVLPLLFGMLIAVPSAQASELTLSVENITMVKAPPTCEVRSTKRIMRSGSTTEIVWKSTRAEYMQGMTRGDRVWPTKGRERFAIAVLGKHEFPLTFVGPGGETTCIAKVFVHPRKSK